MLGALASTKDVGIYDQALKLVNILLTLVTSLGSVMLPRVASLLASGDHKAVNKMHQMSFLIYNLVIFPIIAGMLIVNDDFVRFFLGKDFQDARYAIAIMIFRMFFIGWTNIMGIQILIPHDKNKRIYAVNYDSCYRQCRVEPALLTSFWFYRLQPLYPS